MTERDPFKERVYITAIIRLWLRPAEQCGQFPERLIPEIPPGITVCGYLGRRSDGFP